MKHRVAYQRDSSLLNGTQKRYSFISINITHLGRGPFNRYVPAKNYPAILVSSGINSPVCTLAGS